MITQTEDELTTETKEDLDTDDGCRHVTGLKMYSGDGMAVYTGFVSKDDKPHGSGVKKIATGSMVN